MKSFTIATFFFLVPMAFAAPPFDPAGAKNVGNGAGRQFIGGQCLSNADCASTCCANPTGICSGLGADHQAGKTGCGFIAGGSSAPAATAATTATLTAATCACPAV